MLRERARWHRDCTTVSQALPSMRLHARTAELAMDSRGSGAMSRFVAA